MIEVKHLSTESTLPTFPDDGKLILYSMRFCPYAQRVHLILDAKKIPYHVVNIDLVNKPIWFKEINPFSKVPALKLTNEEEKPIIYESLIIAEYLDENFPQTPTLYPRNPAAKAIEKLWIERFQNIITHLHRILLTGISEAPGSLTEIVNGLDLYENELKRRNTTYFGGVTPGILDYMIWPWCERTDALKYVLGNKYELDKDRYPKLIEWRSVMQTDEAVKISYLPGSIHAKYIEGKKSGYPDYNCLVSEHKRQRTC